MAQNDIMDWFKGIPLITRIWFSLSIIIPLAGRIGLLNPYYMILLYEPTIKHFQLWRPITALLYYPISPATGFHYLLLLYFLYNYSVQLETGTYDRRPADYLYMLMFNWLSLVIIGLLSRVMLLLDPMVLSMLYIWCQLNKDVIVSFWFGTQFKAIYLPWVLAAFNMILQGRYKYLPNRVGGVSGFGAPPVYRSATTTRDSENDTSGDITSTRRRYAWGQGRRLDE
ncbi:derlin-1-like isoform X2 [Gordionus sp. m RMFG-2023]|uniref:derlin-1-like isoform X2 n=1 Tax=Gordionus sp. m RMFG-2023 TaxID=3053472 RepID=UPI0031FC9486